MIQVGDAAPRFRHRDAEGKAISLDDRLLGGSVLLVFLRYTGCPICQMRIGELIRDHERFSTRGVDVFVVVENSPATLAKYLGGRTLPFGILPDPDRKLYDLYGVDSGGVSAMIAARVLKNVVHATVKGYFHGKFDGTESQVPAEFLIDPEGVVRFVHYGRDVSDSTPNDGLLRRIDALADESTANGSARTNRTKLRNRKSTEVDAR